MKRFDWTVIRSAATAGLLAIAPSAVLAEIIFGDGPAALAWLFLLVILFGFGLAGYVAGRLRPDTPIAHGILSGLLCFVVAQAFGFAVVLSRGDRIAWVAIPLTALLAASLSAAGALTSDAVHRREVRASPNRG
ncbi:MAG: hypothetical protein AAF531_27695 [Actinomycetota bacterium]